MFDLAYRRARYMPLRTRCFSCLFQFYYTRSARFVKLTIWNNICENEQLSLLHTKRFTAFSVQMFQIAD